MRGNLRYMGGGVTSLTLGNTTKYVDKDGNISTDHVKQLRMKFDNSDMPTRWIDSIDSAVIQCTTMPNFHYMPYISHRDNNGVFFFGINDGTVELIFFDNEKIANSDNTYNYYVTLFNKDGRSTFNYIDCPSIPNFFKTAYDTNASYPILSVNGDYNIWVRSPMYGILPVKPYGSAACYLGANDWPWTTVFTQKIINNGNLMTANVVKSNSVTQGIDTATWSY